MSHRDDPMRANARELMAQANAELAEKKRVTPKMPERPLVQGVFSFLADPAALLSMLLYGFWLNLIVNLGYAVAYFSGAEDKTQIFAPMLLAGTCILALPFLLWSAAACQAVTRDSASGMDKIENWPGLDVTECLAIFPYSLLPVGTSLLPGYLFGQIAFLAGAPAWVFLPCCLGALWLLYPIALLSTLKSASPLALVANSLLDSMTASAGAWCCFYLMSGGLLIVVGLAVWLIWISWFVAGILPAVALVACVLLYHRLAGRLAWVVTERENASEESRSAGESKLGESKQGVSA